MSDKRTTTYSAEDGALAVSAARTAVDAAVRGDPKPPAPSLPASFFRMAGVFTTLATFPVGELRGCVGFPEPVLPLGQAIIASAVAAALEDRRFEPVQPSELDALTVELSLLTPPVAVDSSDAARLPKGVEVGRHGVIARQGRRGGLLLPQVATDFGWTAEEFLDHACIKAGLPPDQWRKGDVSVLTFEAEIFKESTPRGRVVRHDPKSPAAPKRK